MRGGAAAVLGKGKREAVPPVAGGCLGPVGARSLPGRAAEGSRTAWCPRGPMWKKRRRFPWPTLRKLCVGARAALCVCEGRQLLCVREKGAGCPLCVCTKGAAGVGERSRSVCGVSEASRGASVCVSGEKEREREPVCLLAGEAGVCVREEPVYVREGGVCEREGRLVFVCL